MNYERRAWELGAIATSQFIGVPTREITPANRQTLLDNPIALPSLDTPMAKGAVTDIAPILVSRRSTRRKY